MPTSRAVAAEVHEYCVRKADAERAHRYSRFFTEGYDAYGLDYRDPEWDQNRRKWGERLREAGRTVYLDTGDLLMQSGKYEEASFAILFATDAAGRFTPEAFARIGAWFEHGIRNWAHTDILSGDVLSHFLINGVISLKELRPWRESPYKFQRRAVPVTLIKLLDRGDLLSEVEPLMADPERVVQQGVGWFLRESWKKRPKPTEAFLMRFKDTAPRLIYQYATEKMDKTARERFRRVKAKSQS
jgi:3-methyladenine DNA glycosylase AlkD